MSNDFEYTSHFPYMLFIYRIVELINTDF
jgi:hypothetical protein